MTQEVPTYDQLMWPTLVAIQKLGGSGSNGEIGTQVIEDLDLSEETQAVLLGNGGPRTKVGDRLHWARSYLRMLGLLENVHRGVWAITVEGRRIPFEELEPRHKDFQREYGKQRRERIKQAEHGDEVQDTDGEEDEWQDHLLEVLLDLHPDAFERLCQRLLREAGFIRVQVMGRSGDGGLDGVGVYKMTLVSFPVFFQSKRWRGSVGSKEVRDFRGAMTGRGEKGLLITTGSFTKEAQGEASRDGAPPVDLVDGEELCELLRKYEIGVGTKMVEQVFVDEDALRDI